jgi:class 3 adenylate cyclase
MKANNKPYNLEDSISRIDEILEVQDYSYEERDSIPSRDELTFINGFYVECSALFVDIRKSSELTDFHKNRVLAKLYRAYISEVIAVINGNSKCKELNVVGDCVSGIFDTPRKQDVDAVFDTAAQVSSLIDILNYRLTVNEIREITVGIGVALGRALMVKAGYKGSCINEVVWMGNVVNEASKLASYGNKGVSVFGRDILKSPEIAVSKEFYDRLTKRNQKMLEENEFDDYYQGDVVNGYMNDWYKKNCNDDDESDCLL